MQALSKIVFPLKMYNCKFQIKRENTPRRECLECMADCLNNPLCPDYKSIRLEDFYGIHEFLVKEKEEKF